MITPIKCWMKTDDGDEGEVILDPRLANYLDFGSFAHGSGMEWPQEEPESEDDDEWFDDDEDSEVTEEPVFMSVVFHDAGGITADGSLVVEHRGVPDWAFNGGMPTK